MEIFRGIRYARAERFGPPQMELCPDQPLPGEAGEICPQNTSRMSGFTGRMLTGFTQGEDCLRLSVFTPSAQGRRAVLVWICGGAFANGSGEYPSYDGATLAREGDIVVVSVSYRVGSFGFLYLPEKGAVNLGIKDQACALRWVQKYIGRFGGDPERITVCGQSAGAYSLACILARFAAVKDPVPFRKAILMSGPYLFRAGKEKGRKVRETVAAALPAPLTLESAGVEELLEAQRQMQTGAGWLPFFPVRETTFPGESVPGLEEVLLTCQRDDGRPFAPFRWLTPLVTAFAFRWPMLLYARRLRKLGIKVSTRRFTWRPANGGIGACHCLELPLLFGNWEAWKDAPMLQGVTEAEYKHRGTEFRTAVASFVKD